SPDAKHPEWRLSAAVPESNRNEVCWPSTFYKQQREQRLFDPSSNIRYCGSRVFNTLVGVWGE
ncbi:MAG: hypothetical protein Q4G00_15560, partial [Clostridia bacterium]|nr:hypothetical protein [Clostridia bacterium]